MSFGPQKWSAELRFGAVKNIESADLVIGALLLAEKSNYDLRRRSGRSGGSSS